MNDVETRNKYPMLGSGGGSGLVSCCTLRCVQQLSYCLLDLLVFGEVTSAIIHVFGKKNFFLQKLLIPG